MKYLVYDVETTTRDKGNPFISSNKCCVAGFKDEIGSILLKVEYDDSPTMDNILHWRDLFTKYDLLIGFNLKFDLHWGERYGAIWEGRVWDVQLVHFILTNQQNPFPSLNDVCQYYGLETKLDIVKTEYWEKGLDTTDVPWDILCEYLDKDLELTYQCYLHQVEDVKRRGIYKLVSLANQDLMILQEMEWNGMLYDKEESLKKGEEIENQLKQFDDMLSRLFPYSFINWNSDDHLSAILYGGGIKYEVRHHVGEYKTGDKAGQPRYRVEHLKEVFPRLVEPLKGSELKKEGFFSVSADTLQQLKAKGVAKEVINIVLQRSKLDKVLGTYYYGLPKMIEVNEWDDNIIHGQFNQCVAITGRLSSSKPNKQNIEGGVKDMFISRYKE